MILFKIIYRTHTNDVDNFLCNFKKIKCSYIVRRYDIKWLKCEKIEALLVPQVCPVAAEENAA